MTRTGRAGRVERSLPGSTAPPGVAGRRDLAPVGSEARGGGEKFFEHVGEEPLRQASARYIVASETS